MKELRKYEVVSLRDYCPDNPRQIVITFDDGYKDALHVAAPILRRFCYPFSVFLVGKFVGLPGYLDEDECGALIDQGGNLQWHTQTHSNLTQIDDDLLLDKELYIPDSIRELDPKGFYAIAYPFWAYNHQVLRKVEAHGFSHGRSGNGYCPTKEENIPRGGGDVDTQ